MNNENVPIAVELIKRQFLCAVPVKDIDWNVIFEILTWESQEILVENTVNLNVVLELPIKITYQKAFVKYIIQKLEKLGSEINDCLYDAYGRLVSLADHVSYFKHYYVDSDKIISLKESTHIISEGTTGLCSWQAGIALAQWCFTNKHFLEEKRILELGSGIGLTGLVSGLYCNPKKYYFTDCHNSVLKVLCENIRLNLDADDCVVYEEPDEKKHLFKSRLGNDTELSVFNLSWEEIADIGTDLTDVDLVLAADVVFDASSFGSLRKALCRILKKGTCKQAIFACTERSKDTLQEFLSILEDSSLNLEELRFPPQNNFIWNTETPIRVFAISSSKVSDTNGSEA